MQTRNIKNVLPESVIIELATLSEDEKSLVQQCRGKPNRLGFCYQLMFVKVFNYFPSQTPLGIQEQILIFASLHMDTTPEQIQNYQKRQQTISEHQIKITQHLCLSTFDDKAAKNVAALIMAEAQKTELLSILLAKAENFLRTHSILLPAQDTLKRLIITHKQKARQYIFEKILQLLSLEQQAKLDALLRTDITPMSKLQMLKQPPTIPSPKALLALSKKLEIIQETNVQQIDISWLNNNYQRSLAKYAMRCSVKRIRELQPVNRYAVLLCFLKQISLDTIDHMIDMYHKIMLKVYGRSKKQLDDAMHKQRKHFKKGAYLFNEISLILLDESIPDAELRQTVFNQFGRETLQEHAMASQVWLTGKYSNVFNLVVNRFSYLRQFAPTLLSYLELEVPDKKGSDLLDAVKLLQELNRNNKRKLPDDAPVSFIPKKLQKIVHQDGVLNKQAWECALLTKVRDEIKAGNLTAKGSKRFGNFDNFFISDHQWESERKRFFQKANLPDDPQQVPAYLTTRLNKAFDGFLSNQEENAYAKVKEDHWTLSVDPAETLSEEEESALAQLKNWLAKNMRQIKLPLLLIEVDNDLKFTQEFMLPHQQLSRQVEDVCAILVSIMAHGCFIGPYTMARLTSGVSYKKIRRITDWQLSEEAQRAALALIVNAITTLDVSKSWGDGRTSSSDGQRYKYKRKSLQQTYSVKFSDFALEFYTFVADNYAPFYSIPHECTDRDAPYALDGMLYNESDLVIEEHYTDTHGYTEINFAAFAMFGKTFSPRIRGVKDQRIYRIDDNRDYGSLRPLVSGKDHLIRLNQIQEEWDKMGHFYASLADGHATASSALKRLTGFSSKNHFYLANRELGRVFKTENILNYMADPLLRQNRRRGLLKGEQIHQLARDVAYGKQGKISARDLQGQRNTCSCLTLILASIIYWQAKEIKRVLDSHGHVLDKQTQSMLPHISPIGWDNLILYGEYILDRSLIR